MMSWRDKDFHVSEMIGQGVQTEKTNRESERTLAPTESFKQACDLVLKAFEEKNKSRSEDEMTRWQKLQHDAVIGKQEAVKLFKEEIEEYLRNAQLLQVKQPSYYESLVEAVFQETFGLGPISVWWKHPKFSESQSARIIGKKIYFDIPGERALRKFTYDSEQTVIENIIEKIRMKDEFAHINKFNPKLEMDLEDGTRVTILIPPRVRKTTLIFRNVTIRKPMLEDFVQRGSIPTEALPILRGMAKSMLNMVVMGKVRSAKTTLLKALFAERYREGQVAVTIENGHSEMKLGDIYPDAQLIEMIVRTAEEYDEVFAQVLRSDYHFCVVGEMRSVEAELYCMACERGEGGSMTSYHTEKMKNMPGQITRLILQRYPGRDYQNELIRVAECLDIGIVMKELPDGSKRLHRISEIRLDPYTLQVTVHDVMRWDSLHNDWTYANDLSPETREKMREASPGQTGYAEQAFRALEKLSKEKPIIGSNVEQEINRVAS
ncbi:ATPase, T2SS/T4P/T4SS family [Paenibacillus sp. MMO-58]|uniref:ATPase, T2SS/T4P/T4SS family n=1 Tax=Paenibacillus sp. MMO-58 TaxID=3081290 RepID=UPI003019A7AF